MNKRESQQYDLRMNDPHLKRIHEIRHVVYDIMEQSQREKKTKIVVNEVQEKLKDTYKDIEPIDIMQYMGEWRRKYDPRPKPNILKKMLDEAPRPRPNNFEYKLSPELANILGEEVLSGNVIIKKIMRIINTEKLRDPRNISRFVPNDMLKPVFTKGPFEVKKIRMLLDEHLTPLW